MNRALAPLAIAIALLGGVTVATPVASAVANPLHWEHLAPVPDGEGFAAPFAGVSGGALILAGGSNISGNKWADPMTKKWYSSAFVLERPAAAWRSGFKLPHPLAYGVSITADDSVICIGGSDERQHHAGVFRLTWSDGRLRTATLPSLPKPCANACGALLGRTIYIAGGIETPTAIKALKTFWALDLDHLDRGWRELDPWPGPERMLGVAGVQDGSFFLLTGARLAADGAGAPVREFLRDAYRFTPGRRWTQIADLPRAACAARSPAVPFGTSELLILSGDDGANVAFQPVKRHPGIPTRGARLRHACRSLAHRRRGAVLPGYGAGGDVGRPVHRAGR